MADKRLIPQGIRDVNTEALNELIDRLGTLDLTPLLIYIIDNVDESALPHLIEQFHVEGYDLAKTDSEKRNLIKKSLELHRYKGTKYALSKVLEILGIEGEILEWFEYQGEPYKFKIYLSQVKTSKVWEEIPLLIEAYKNVRSHLDGINYFFTRDLSLYLGGIVPHGYSLHLFPNVNNPQIQSNIYTCSAFNKAYSYTVNIHNPSLNVENSNLYTATVLNIACKLEVRYG